MAITANVLADSTNSAGKRLTTVLLGGFQKFLQAELNTHRMLSRGSASSRAIPNEKLRSLIVNEPALPVFWGANTAGMQAHEELDAASREKAIAAWLNARDAMLEASEMLAKIGVHKQLCNRLVEPWMPVSIIISATEWENFFRQRCHPDAQPEMRRAAEVIRDAMAASVPRKLEAGEWHLPLVRRGPGEDDQGMSLDDQVKLSVARCARVSYLSHNGRRDPQADLDLYQRLISAGHWGPHEHAAEALNVNARIGNFIGFRQHRAGVDPHFLHSA